jgi:drug/metabolite transporter (DMT)-like permease
MQKERFPFALPLTTLHMLTTLLLSNLLYWLKPSLYPAMEKTQGQRIQLLRWFVPMGCLFAMGLFCSNKAYTYCSVAFLQFMKESNVALVFGLGSLAGLQQCTRSRLFVLLWILTGAFIAVRGEMHFVLMGFIVQGISQLGECGKTVLGEWTLRGSSLKLDPLTFTMFLSPVSLFFLFFGTYFTWQHEILLRAAEWWHLLLPNAFLAFFLNVLVAVVIKDFNAVTFMLSGLIKDMGIVLASIAFFGEVVILKQLCGFAICLGGIALWSTMRVWPDCTAVRLVQTALGERYEAEIDELNALLKKKAQQV